MRGTRKKTRSDKAGASGDAGEAKCSSDEIALVKHCGLIGCNKLEAEDKLGRPLTDKQLIDAYASGRADHAYTIMGMIYEKAMSGSEKLLVWLAENNLKRSIDQQTGDAVIDAMSPEQRREEIRKMTKKLAIT